MSNMPPILRQPYCKVDAHFKAATEAVIRSGVDVSKENIDEASKEHADEASREHVPEHIFICTCFLP